MILAAWLAWDSAHAPRASPSGLVATAAAQQVDRVVPPAAVSGAVAPVDEAFSHFAASAGLAQVEAAGWVLRTTRDGNVRQYAQRIERDHARSREALGRIAKARGVSLPSTPTGRHLDLLTKLKGVQATDLDDAFLRRFGIDAHKEAIALFERHVESGQDAELKRHAEQMLPTLREHMVTAQKLLHAANAR